MTTVPETSAKPYVCPVCLTRYFTAEHAAGCADEHQHPDCPYLAGTGKCVSGCTTEPRCVTGGVS